MAGIAEPQEGLGLARAWTTCGPKMLRHQRPDEALCGAEGTVTMEQRFCFVLLLLLTCHSCQISKIVHSVVLPTIFEKDIHTKIKTNLLKSVACITPKIHVRIILLQGINLDVTRR